MDEKVHAGDFLFMEKRSLSCGSPVSCVDDIAYFKVTLKSESCCVLVDDNKLYSKYSCQILYGSVGNIVGENCVMCAQGQRLEALVNGFGYSKL